MLSKTHKNTPARLAAGLVGTGALGLAALGLTASGTQAAETIKVKVETVTGIELGQDVPAAPQSAPAAAEAPAKPEGPVKVRTYSYTVSSDDKEKGDKDGKRVTKIVMVHADGSKTENEMPDMDKIRVEVPEIRDGKCTDTNDGKPVIVNRQEGGKKIMIICSNRIEKITVDAQKVAFDAKRVGMNSAMMGLRMARHSIESQSDLSAEQRAKALKGIDEAIAEVQKNGGEDN